jgi:pyrimidine-nucleoside phosphorylase
MLDLIEKTRDGVALSRDEVQRLVDGTVDRRWPDYQLAAWLMAVVCRGLTDQETVWLTGAMAFSGGEPEPLGLVDKHSTGGVGDKTTLVLAPLMASMGYPMAKMSGRGLGHTGGTLDKLESIPGFRVELSRDEVRRQVDQIGVAVVAQSHELAPADRRLYALRDVTGTVNNRSLIASSIMSKKLAAGTPNLVLDVKVGNGAFMADLSQARRLAELMVHRAGLQAAGDRRVDPHGSTAWLGGWQRDRGQ